MEYSYTLSFDGMARLTDAEREAMRRAVASCMLAYQAAIAERGAFVMKIKHSAWSDVVTETRFDAAKSPPQRPGLRLLTGNDLRDFLVCR
jgi:hypothetical protein